MHEANDLVPPPMHPWHFRQFPENDCRGDTPFETAKLPKEGNLDISHLLNLRGKVGEQKGPKPLNHMKMLAQARNRNSWGHSTSSAWLEFNWQATYVRGHKERHIFREFPDRIDAGAGIGHAEPDYVTFRPHGPQQASIIFTFGHVPRATFQVYTTHHNFTSSPPLTTSAHTVWAEGLYYNQHKCTA